MSDDLIKKEYHFKAMIRVRPKTYFHPIWKKNVETKVVMLIPRTSTQVDQFYAAWLPRLDNPNAIEVEIFIKAPIQDRGRVQMVRKDSPSADFREAHYLHVMDENIEKQIEHMDGKIVDCFSLPAEDTPTENPDFSM